MSNIIQAGVGRNGGQASSRAQNCITYKFRIQLRNARSFDHLADTMVVCVIMVIIINQSHH